MNLTDITIRGNFFRCLSGPHVIRAHNNLSNDLFIFYFIIQECMKT